MRINSVMINGAGLGDADGSPKEMRFCGKNGVSVIMGKDACLVLACIRSILGDGSDDEKYTLSELPIEICAELEHGGKTYDACYIKNADGPGKDRMAVNFTADTMSFSAADTDELLFWREHSGANAQNVFTRADATTRRKGYSKHLSECEQTLINLFDFFAYCARQEKSRPVFVYELLEMLDDSVLPEEVLDALSRFGLQIFISSEKLIDLPQSDGYDIIKL